MEKKVLFLSGVIVVLFAITSIVSCGGESTGKGQEFIIANGAEIQSLDIHKISGVPEHNVSLALSEGLVRANPKTSKAEPAVAESWTVDGKVYTMKIRPNLVWSDGVPITAETVRDSWFRMLDPETASPYAWFPAMFIKGAQAYNSGEGQKSDVAIKALDANTFQFETVGDVPYVLDALTHYAFGVVPMHVIEKFGDEWTLPENFVSNGPFVLEKWSQQEILTVQKNEKYWDAENVFLDTISFIPTDNLTTMYNMFENGEVDWATTVPPGKYESLKGRNDFQINPQLATYYYLFNNQRAPFDDVRVRRAFALSIGREDIAHKLLGEGQIPAYGMVPSLPGYTSVDKVSENVEEAQRLLADAGYPNGEGFPKFSIVYNTSEGHKKIAEFVQQRWKETLNVDITLINQEWKTFLDTRKKHDFDIARGGWVGDYPDPNTFLDMFVQGSDLNDPDYQSDEYDELIHNAAIQKGAERMETLRKAETLLVNQDVALIPLYFYVTMNLIDTTVWDGWYTNAQDVHPYVGIKKIAK